MCGIIGKTHYDKYPRSQTDSVKIPGNSYHCQSISLRQAFNQPHSFLIDFVLSMIFVARLLHLGDQGKNAKYMLATMVVQYILE